MIFPNRKNTFVYFDGGEFKTSKIKFTSGKVLHYRLLGLFPEVIRDGVILDEDKNIYPVNKKLLLKGFVDDRQAITREQAERFLTGATKSKASVKKRSGSKEDTSTSEVCSQAVQLSGLQSADSASWDEISKAAELAYEEQIGSIYYSQD